MGVDNRARPPQTAGWAQVADQYRAIKAAGHLSEGDQRVLEALQKRGLGAGL